MKNLLLLVLFAIVLAPTAHSALTKCIGHKGDMEREFENSMASFISTYERGASGIEYDIWHTKDGIALVVHDKDLSVLANSKPGKECPLSNEFTRSVNSQFLAC